MRGGPRDSDASYTSNRPSTASVSHGGRQAPVSDAALKQSWIRRINSYLSSHNCPYSLSLKPLPSNRDITETLKFILSQLDFTHSPSSKLDDDLQSLLKSLNCPLKLNRSALKAPGTPHAFPHVLAVIHWLVQIADFKDHLSPNQISESDDSSGLYNGLDPVTAHALSSYIHFMCGDDDAVDGMNAEFESKMEREKNVWMEKVDSLDNEIAVLEAKLVGLRTGPSALESLEEEQRLLEKDEAKFQDFIAKLADGVEAMKKSLEGKENELAVALEEKGAILMECGELYKAVETQKIDPWVADSMRREILSVERETRESDEANTQLEDKCWSLDERISHQLKELEALSTESNHLLRKLKLATDLQYVLNAEGSTVADVLGVDSKLTIKPALKSLSDETNKNSVANSEELLVLQQRSVELNKKIEAKKNHISELRHSIDETETQLSYLEKEMQNLESRCAAEAQNMWKVNEAEAQILDIKERETNQTLTAAELKLREAEKQSKDEIQRCAYELAVLIEDVSKFKEYMETRLHEMEKEISETAGRVSDTYKQSLSLQFNMVFTHPRNEQLSLDPTTFRELKKAKNY